ncbi:ribonuclease H family protein [Streptomyces luteolus]|uniref:Ribonuclease H n=1 Tax=Streptomyces luteolus TaxID=3043615 RepID=A0ABT6TA96_9ACTN|nr:ribonuclease H [Streptomyces sp. B-S-A12]MDI3424315.1 ribonuclease H [Streptomyces sp. B-S-A12]
MSERMIAACDGAAKKNPGPAAWAWVLADPAGTPQRWEAGPLGVATNNVAELTALAELLESTDPAVPLEIRMDSQYAMNAVTKWIAGWKRNGWQTASKKPVANKDLVVRIDALLGGRDVTFEHVLAHQVDGDPLNAIADAAASTAATDQRAAGTAHGSDGFPEPGPQTEDKPRTARPRKKAAPRTGGGPVIKAKFPGRCGHCQSRYDIGEKITKIARGWGHEGCREAAPAS